MKGLKTAVPLFQVSAITFCNYTRLVIVPKKRGENVVME